MRAVNRIGIFAVSTLFVLQPACSSGSDNPDAPANGTPASLQITQGDNQVAAVSTSVPTIPTVAVRDAQAEPVAGVIVVFSVESGGGSITDSVVTTDANGLARLGSWTLGASPGINMLKVSVSGLQPMVLRATGQAPAEDCSVVQPLTIGGTLNGALAANCPGTSNIARDSISLVTTAQQALSFTLTGPLRYRMFFSSTGGGLMPPIDRNDLGSSSETKRLIMNPGSFRGALLALQPATAGPYSVTVTAIPEDNTGCTDSWLLMLGVTTTQSITNNDCAAIDGVGRYDEFAVQMIGTTTYTFSAQTTTAKEIEIWAPNDSLAQTTGVNNNATSATLTTAVSVTGTYK
jgi:hypothetical protein